MTDQIVSSAPLTVSSTPSPPNVLNNAVRITTASEFGLNPGGVLTQMARITVASSFVLVPANDCWVWDGSQEVPASVSVWDGVQEVPASLTVT
jgi:hypothetical protein